ncbi:MULTISPECIES: hypothetical protein [unclassified Pseudomonas]|uniref:hypothetical protein n=1 Tax=unclassified Pseudomonas TaxID=196821 RepID=UPI000CD29C5A|nr:MULTISPECIES: hypothetical protein [unclassified Pseudomonas]POA31887.1 hypothetical protein C1887_12120 [Pseudomonas sp. GW456-R21]POA68618.1 hypothetical protein C1884_09765 [Pseudomonas sp. GW460-R15]
MNDRLCLVFVPALVALLTNAEKTKGSPLTESEVLTIRDQAACIAVPVSSAIEMEEKRGYADIVAEDCWVGWLSARSQIFGS